MKAAVNGNKEPLTIEQIKGLDTDPHSVIQTGYETIHIVMETMLLASTGITPYTLPYAATDMDSVDDLESATPTTFVEKDEGGNPKLMMIMNDLYAQAMTYIRACGVGVWPDLTNSTCLINFFGQDVRAGLLNKMPPLLDEDLQDCTTLDEVIKGINWKDDSAGTVEKHETWIRRFMYVLGLTWSIKFPNFTDKVQTTDAQTYIDRVIDIVVCLAVIVLWHAIVLACIQSDRAVFNIALIRDNLVSKKIDRDMLKSAVDPAWNNFMKENKLDVLSTSMSGHSTYTTDFVLLDMIDGATLENSIYEYKTQFIVPKLSLEIARQFFGIGRWDKNGEQVNFMFLLNGVPATSGGNYDTHGETQWELGINTAVGISYLQNVRGWDQDLRLMIEKQKHWTWADIKGLVDEDFFVTFSMQDSLKGFIENDAYRGIRIMSYHTDSTYNSNCVTTEGVRSPSGIHSTGTLKTTFTDSGIVGATWAYIWTQKFITERYKLFMATDTTMDQLRFILFYGLWLGLDSSTTWQTTRYSLTEIRLVEMVEAKDTKKCVCLAYASGAVQIRFEAIPNVLDFTTYGATALKFMVGLTDKNVPYTLKFSAARPKGLENNWGCYIADFGRPEKIRELARLIFRGGSNRAAPLVTEEKPKAAPKLPKVAKAPDGKASNPEKDEDEDE